MTTNPQSTRYLSRLPERKWAPIARGTQARWGAWDWVATDNAPVTIAQAKRLYDDGLIEMMQARQPDGTFTQFVWRRKRVAVRAPWFGRDALSGHEMRQVMRATV